MKIEVSSDERIALSIILEFVKQSLSDDRQIKLWMDLAAMNLRDIDFLKKMLVSVGNNLSVMREDKLIQCEFNDASDCVVACNGDKGVFSKDISIKLLSGIISVLEPVLPIGSVVKLKKSFLDDVYDQISKNHDFNEKYLQIFSSDEFLDIDVMIERRFVEGDVDGFYFEYVGVIYPIIYPGVTNNPMRFSFGCDDIREVVHEGYVNDMEKKYSFIIKREVIVNNHYLSSSTILKEGE